MDRRCAATFAANPTQVSAARAELIAARAVGLPVQWSDSLDAPFPTHGAVTLADQAQVDPSSLLTALAAELREHGGLLTTRARVDHVDWFGPAPLRGSRFAADGHVLEAPATRPLRCLEAAPVAEDEAACDGESG